MINVLLCLALTLCGSGLLFMNLPNHDYSTINSTTIRFFQNKIHLQPSPPARYLTYEYYFGRFGNQLQQMEWAYRIALLTNRTLVITKPFNKETYAGFPASWERAHEGYSLWDTELLKTSPVRFHFYNDSDVVPENVHANCTWTNAQGPFLAAWAYRHTNLPECHSRLHFASGQGIPGEYRSDTRDFGIDPLVFWRHVRFSKPIMKFVEQQLVAMLGDKTTATVGVHARTYRESRTSQEKVEARVCGPQTLSVPRDISQRLHNRMRCKCPVVVPYNVSQRWLELNLHTSCDMTKNTSFPLLTNRTAESLLKSGFFIATDHEDKQVDTLFLSRGARMMNFSIIPRAQVKNPGMYEVKLESLVVDLAALIHVDEFFGIPASTLTRAVCYWRLSMGKQDPMCELLLYRTYSARCSERTCGNTPCCK